MPKHHFLFSLAWIAASLVVLGVAITWAVVWPPDALSVLADGPASQAWIPVEPEDDTIWLAGAEEGPSIRAHAAILFENTTGTVIYAKNPHQTRAPASTTKILTAILALEMAHLDDIVTVSRKAAGTPGSTARLYTGQKIRMDDLLHGLLLSSGNDAAVAIAEHIAGSEEAFSYLMNARAHMLGATQSRFINAHGLDKPGHFSTAYDLAMLSKAALLYPTFQEIVAKRTYAYERGTWTNTNKLLWRYEGVEGIKTGTTGQAGYCLVATATQDGMQLISVVLGSTDRWQDTTALLDYGFNQFHRMNLAQRGDVLARVPVAGSPTPLVAVAAAPISLIVRDEEVSHVTTQIHLEGNLRAPIAKGARLGTYDIYVNGEQVKSVGLVAGERVDKETPFRLGWRFLIRLFTRAPEVPSTPSTS